MINDILEQVVEDYFRSQGYFTQHNVKYRPDISNLSIKDKRSYSVHSDIDILGIHPLKVKREKVIVVNCKSWQGGLDIKKFLRLFKTDLNKKDSGREVWKKFREVTNKAWARALEDKILQLSGQREFKLYLAVTKYKGNKRDWGNFQLF